MRLTEIWLQRVFPTASISQHLSCTNFDICIPIFFTAIIDEFGNKNAVAWEEHLFWKSNDMNESEEFWDVDHIVKKEIIAHIMCTPRKQEDHLYFEVY